MAQIRRESPVPFAVSPLKSEVRDHWTVALAYPDEGDGPWLVDLSHKVRWTLQDRGIGQMTVCRLVVPAAPGSASLTGNSLVSRMNATQASVCHFGPEAPPLPESAGYTDVGEATLCLALLGPGVFRVAEKLTDLDLTNPASEAPCLLQGPFCRVPCQIAVLQKDADGSGGFLLTCSRGYGDAMIAAILEAGGASGLRPAGEDRFHAWLETLTA